VVGQLYGTWFSWQIHRPAWALSVQLMHYSGTVFPSFDPVESFSLPDGATIQ